MTTPASCYDPQHLPTHPPPDAAPWQWERLRGGWAPHRFREVLPIVTYWRDDHGVAHPLVLGSVRCDFEFLPGRRCLSMFGHAGDCVDHRGP